MTIRAGTGTLGIYDLPVTEKLSYSPGSPLDSAQVWQRRARFRRRTAKVLGFLCLILLVTVLEGTLSIRAGSGPPGGGSGSPEADPWVIVTALGSLAAGIGAVASGVAAILAVRAAAAVQKTTPVTDAEQQRTAVAAKKPPAKRKKKRRRLN